jgi:4-alpha-glucanotransferase
MGDDCEKFGVWPKTFEHCFTNGWLERFYRAMEANSEWLETATPAEALRTHTPLGRADLPAASYMEMMEWALPTPARAQFRALEKEFAGRADVLPFLRGGQWRNFLTKYPESNLMHKKMLHVSGKIRRLERSRSDDAEFSAARGQARRHLMRGQCNDAYWHGVFGGLYSPHLRTGVWRSLIRAESLADELTNRKENHGGLSRFDFDADGSEEIYFTSETCAAVVKPSDGATIAALDFRPTAVSLINSIARRPEAYHERLRGLKTGASNSVVSIHDQVNVKEEGLEKWLYYDRWARHCFRLLAFSKDKNYADYQKLELGEDAALAGGAYRELPSNASTVRLGCGGGSAPWRGEKQFSFASKKDEFQVACDVSLKNQSAAAAALQIGIETVINLLAPAAPDRYIECAGKRHSLRLTAAVPASEVNLVDEWQNVRATIAAPGARDFWVSPIEAVSESEDGFERVYQGSQILAVWRAEISPGQTWNARLTLKVARARP